MRDGDIDYSKYTLRELEEAIAGINPRAYPKNHANLRSAYERLTSTLPAQPQTVPRSDSYYPMRKQELGWTVFGLVMLYAASLFAAMLRNPRYTGLPRLSIANFVDAQPFALTFTVGALIWFVVDSRRGK
jgi:hypothetical protein